MPANDPDEIWTRSDLLPDGSYALTLELNSDHSLVMDEAAAVSYALAVLDAVQAAEYDAAVLRQLTRKLGLDENTVVPFIAEDLRPSRRPLRDTGTPLTLTPGVSHRDRRGFLTLTVDGTPVGQWELDDARTHARYVLETLLAAEYDTAYHHALTSVIRLEDDRARSVVADIVNHRPADG